MTDLTNHRRRLDRLLTDHAHARRRVREERVTLKQAKTDLAAARQAQTLVQTVAAAVQEQAHRQLAAVVTRCLATVFGEVAYEFVIRFDRKRGKTEARLLFLRDGLEVDPVDAAGGGVVDVAAFALRLACLLLATPRRRQLLVLDEPLKHLSKQYRPTAARLIETLAKEMGVQFLIVTHDPALQIGKVIEVGD